MADRLTEVERRLRDLELWAVATHAQIGRIQDRAEAMEPVVEQLERAAEAHAILSEAAAKKQTIRLGHLDIPTKTVSLLVGGASLATFALRFLGRGA